MAAVYSARGTTEEAPYIWRGLPKTESIIAVLDPSGQPIADLADYAGKTLSDLPGQDLGLKKLDWVYGLPRPTELPLGYRSEETYMVPTWQDDSWFFAESKKTLPWLPYNTAAWYYFPNQGRFYGFQRTVLRQSPWEETYAPLGSVGPDGFQPPSSRGTAAFPRAVGRFGLNEFNGSSKVRWIASQSDVWRIDFGEKKVQRVLSRPADDAIVATSNEQRGGTMHRWSPEALAVLPDLHVQSRWQTWWRFEWATMNLEQGGVFFALTQSGRLLVLGASEGPLADIDLRGIVGPTEMLAAGHVPGRDRFYVATRTDFLELAKSGEVLARFALPEQSPLKRYTQVADATVMDGYGRTTVAVRTVLVQPTPWVPAFRLAGIAETWVRRVQSPRLPGDVTAGRPERVSTWERAWPALASSLAALILCAAVMRGRALPRGERAAWLLGAAALGPGVVLGLWGFYDSPAKELCPACGRKRLVTRERCEHCGAEFGAPTATGIEIVETGE